MTDEKILTEAAGTRPQRLRSAAVVSAAAVTGLALGLGGASLALWQDAVPFAGSISSGYEYFAAGLEGETTAVSDPVAPPTGDSVAVSVGTDQAATLVAAGELAVVLQTDSLSQGNKGLQYTLAPPADWGDGLFGAADVSIYWVSSPDQCEVGTDPATPPSHVDGHTSTSVAADYSDAATPTTEYWCLVATLDALPDDGSYTNEVTATGTDPSDTEVSDTDSWSADVTSAMDPADEPDHEITFTYTTFRPGEEPQS